MILIIKLRGVRNCLECAIVQIPLTMDVFRCLMFWGACSWICLEKERT